MDNQKETVYGCVKVVRRSDNKWGVLDLEGNEIVPFGRYEWIDGFASGLARVRGRGKTFYSKNVKAIIKPGCNTIIKGHDNIQAEYNKEQKENPDIFAKWGIINEDGEEVLPVVYTDIWKFYGKNKISTKVVKDGVETDIYFYTLNPKLRANSGRFNEGNENLYGSNYGEFAGTYAQDVMGYSDDVINDAFDGEPDAYWNID